MSEQVSVPSFYAVIPAHVRYCKELEANAKLLYGELTALANMSGYCWASNQYFAELYGVEVRSIQNWLESLKKHGFIHIEIQKKGMKTDRKIWISNEIKEMFATRKNLHGRHEKNCTVDMKEISPIIIHSVNTTEEQQQAASAAAAVPPKKESRKAKRLVVYDCLKEVDILAKEKDWLTSHYDEQVVKEAIAWATSPYITITTTLTQAIKWACKERPETPKEKLSVYEAIKQVFSHGEFYNGALCDLNETGISFDRGMKHEQLSFDKSFSWAKFEALCRSFGIVDLVRR